MPAISCGHPQVGEPGRSRVVRSIRWHGVGALGLLASAVSFGAPATGPAGVAELAREVRNKGWIAYGNFRARGDMDLYLMRPDGSDSRKITDTPDMHEGAPQFSPDGRKLLYRRVRRTTKLEHRRFGFQGRVIIANADGSDPVAIGEVGEHPWACWSPDSKQVSCLTLEGIQIVDLATEKVVRTLPRKGIYEHLYWSPDGKWFCGVANTYGGKWTVVRLNAETGQTNPLFRPPGGQAEGQSRGSDISRGLECAPDWFPDAKRVLFSRRPHRPEGHSWTQLWMASADGKHVRPVHAEEGRHLYGGTVSPDGKYVLFSRAVWHDRGGQVSVLQMGLTRRHDVPTFSGEGNRFQEAFPNAKRVPVLGLPAGLEPDWTYANVKEKESP